MKQENTILRHKLLSLMMILLMGAAGMIIASQSAFAEGEAAVLPEAVDGVITLTEDISLESTAVFTEDTTLDLAGHTISGLPGRSSLNVTGGVLTIGDSSADQSGKIAAPDQAYTTAVEVTGAAVVLESGEISLGGQQSYGIWAKDGSSVTLNGGKITASGDEIAGIWLQRGSKATVDGGAIDVSGTGSIGIATNGTASKVSSASVLNGSITASGQGCSGIYLAGAGQKASVSGGSIVVEGDDSYGIQTVAFMTPAHEITISNGTISASGNNRACAVSLEEENTLNMSGGTLESTTGSAVVLYQSNTVSVTGGTITGKVYGINNAQKPTSNVVEIADEAVVTGESEAVYPCYVLMNIPYADFYAAELAEGAPAVDAVSSATKNKPRTGTLAGGSYHKNADGTDISGAIYPVYLTNMSLLKDMTKITDDSSVSITVTNRGKETTTEYTGKDALFESADYSYYMLSEKPAAYKEMKANADGAFVFGPAKAEVKSIDGATGTVTAGARHANVEIKLTLPEGGIAQGDKFAGAVITDNDGNKYGLRHVVNVWRATEIGWNLTDMDLGGKTIKNITYFTTDGTYSYDADIALPSANEMQARVDVAAAQNVVNKLPEDASTEDVKAAYEKLSEAYHSLADALKESGEENAELTAALTALDNAIEKMNNASDKEKEALQNQVDELQKTIDEALTDISNYEMTLKKTAYTYTGKAIKPAVTVKGLSAEDYTVAYANNIKIGTATVTVTGNADKKYTGTITKTFKITKIKNTMQVKPKTVKVKKNKKTVLKTAKVFKVTKAVGKVTYKKASGNKKITVASNGKVTVKKGLKKGTYKVKTKVTAAGSAKYTKLTKAVTFTVVVK